MNERIFVNKTKRAYSNNWKNRRFYHEYVVLNTWNKIWFENKKRCSHAYEDVFNILPHLLFATENGKRWTNNHAHTHTQCEQIRNFEGMIYHFFIFHLRFVHLWFFCHDRIPMSVDVDEKNPVKATNSMENRIHSNRNKKKMLPSHIFTSFVSINFCFVVFFSSSSVVQENSTRKSVFTLLYCLSVYLLSFHEPLKWLCLWYHFFHFRFLLRHFITKPMCFSIDNQISFGFLLVIDECSDFCITIFF